MIGSAVRLIELDRGEEGKTGLEGVFTHESAAETPGIQDGQIEFAFSISSFTHHRPEAGRST